MKSEELKINNQELQNRKRSDRAAFLQYTILFCILVIGIYGVLIISHKSFIRVGDGLKQGYFWTVELKHYIDKLFSGKGISVWSWSKILGMSVETSNYWDPFNWIAAAFPAGYIELGYTITALMRIYCGGAIFLVLMRYTGLSVFASVLGAAAYAFSGYNIATGIAQADFLMSIYLFPLLVLSVEMVYKGRSPAYFSLATALYVVSKFYYSYMAALSIIPYILLRYFAYRKFEAKDFAKNAGKFVLYGIIGVCIGGIQFLSDFAALSEASTESATDFTGILFDKYYYLNLGSKLIGTGDFRNPSIMGWTLIVIILLVIAVAGRRLSNTPAIMSILLLAGVMIPAVCSLYNGMGYPSQRWIFSLELFAAWAAAAEIDEKRMLSRKGTGLAIATLAVIAFWTLGVNRIFLMGKEGRSVTFMVIQLIGGIAFIVLLKVCSREGHLRRLSKIMILVIFAGTLTAAWTVSFADNKGKLYRNNKINKMLQKSTQRAGALIEDDGFYRVDQVDSILYRHRVKLPPNETLWWQTRSIYGYNSRISADLLEFNRLVGNNYGYAKRVSVNSNDNRTGLDYLYGVKYFLGDDIKNGRAGSDEYAGYGFSEYDVLDGVRVFRSKYDVSLGYMFDSYMSESEFEKLGYAEREQALLQAVVLPDDVVPASVSRTEADDIRTAVKDIDYKVVECDGVTLNEDSIVVDKSQGTITLEAGTVENSQLLLSITGLLRNVTEGQSESFELYARNEYVEEVINNKLTNQTIPGIKDYNLNFGYYDNYSNGRIKLLFWAPGTYTYDEIKLKAMDADLFDDTIEELNSRRYKIDSFSDTMVEGTVDSENNAILFLSITEPEKWECYVDGKKTDVISNTDIAFTGVEVPAGHHSVTLKYRNRMAEKGALLSLAGIAALVCTGVIRRRKNKTPVI